jgi:hypothetical protein
MTDQTPDAGYSFNVYLALIIATMAVLFFLPFMLPQRAKSGG